MPVNLLIVKARYRKSEVKELKSMCNFYYVKMLLNNFLCYLFPLCNYTKIKKRHKFLFNHQVDIDILDEFLKGRKSQNNPPVNI